MVSYDFQGPEDSTITLFVEFIDHRGEMKTTVTAQCRDCTGWYQRHSALTLEEAVGWIKAQVMRRKRAFAARDRFVAQFALSAGFRGFFKKT